MSRRASIVVNVATGEDEAAVEVTDAAGIPLRPSPRKSVSAKQPAKRSSLALLSSAPGSAPPERPQSAPSGARRGHRKSLVQENIDDLMKASNMPAVQASPRAAGVDSTAVDDEPAEGSWLAQQALAAQEKLRSEHRAVVRERRASLAAAAAAGTSEGLVDSDGVPAQRASVVALGSGEDWDEVPRIPVAAARTLVRKVRQIRAANRLRAAHTGSALAKLVQADATPGRTSRVSRASRASLTEGSADLRRRTSLVDENRAALLQSARLVPPAPARVSTRVSARVSARASAADADDAPGDGEDGGEPPEGTWLAVQAQRLLHEARRREKLGLPAAGSTVTDTAEPTDGAPSEGSLLGTLGDMITNPLGSMASMTTVCVSPRPKGASREGLPELS